MSKDQKKVLFVVDYLGQFGAERYLYEIIKVLVSHNVYVSVFSIVELHDPYRYYIKLIEKLGVKVYVLPDSLYPSVQNPIINKAINSLAYRVMNKLDSKFIHNKLESNLVELSRHYDVVSIIKWDLYKSGLVNFDKISNKKIHVMGWLSQYSSNPYQQLPTDEVDFVVYYPEQVDEILNGRMKDEKHKFYTIPLLIDNENWDNMYSPKKDGILRIGIFSRIHYDQPTIFAFPVVANLKEKGVKIELYFFGKFFDKSFYEHYIKTVEILKISDVVKFMGHTEDIGQAIADNNLDVGIMNSADSSIGYSSIELQSHGLPVIFFNVSTSGYSSSEFPFVCNTVSEMSNKIYSLWKENKFIELSNESFIHAKNEYGTKYNIDKIVNVFMK